MPILTVVGNASPVDLNNIAARSLDGDDRFPRGNWLSYSGRFLVTDTVRKCSSWTYRRGHVGLGPV